MWLSFITTAPTLLRMQLLRFETTVAISIKYSSQLGRGSLVFLAIGLILYHYDLPLGNCRFGRFG